MTSQCGVPDSHGLGQPRAWTGRQRVMGGEHGGPAGGVGASSWCRRPELREGRRPGWQEGFPTWKHKAEGSPGRADACPWAGHE